MAWPLSIQFLGDLCRDEPERTVNADRRRRVPQGRRAIVVAGYGSGAQIIMLCIHRTPHVSVVAWHTVSDQMADSVTSNTTDVTP